MTDCFIYDAVRTPRGRGKKDGALHEVTALELATQALQAIRERSELETEELDVPFQPLAGLAQKEKPGCTSSDTRAEEDWS